MPKRVRVIKYVVQPHVVVDDGENLQELPLEPTTVPAAQWEQFVSSELPKALEGLEKQVNMPAKTGK